MATTTSLTCFLILFILRLGFSTSTRPLSNSSIKHSSNHISNDSSSNSSTWHLIHRHSIASPFHNPSLTNPKQRLQHAYMRSSARVALMRKHKFGLDHNSHLFYTLLDAADYGSGAEYLMEISIGTPPQKFLAVADTGSSLVWLQCSPCQNCTTSHGAIFQPSLSSSYHTLPCNNTLCQLLNSADFAYFNPDLLECASSKCDFEYLYGDLSTAMGTLSSESIFLQHGVSKWDHIDNFVFGCAHHSVNDFFVTGLIGLGPRPYSFPSQLSPTLGQKFSYCLVDFQHAINTSSLMYFGEPPLTKGMMYTPLLNSYINTSSYYYVALEGISLGDKRLDIPKGTFDYRVDTLGGTILDTGTTFTFVPQIVYKEITNALDSMVIYSKHVATSEIEYSGLLCYDTSNSKHVTWPKFTLHFKDMNLTLPEKNTYIRVSDHSYCLAITSSTVASSNNENLTIIGNIAQQNFLVKIDTQNHVVGFFPTNCVHTSKTSS